MSGDETSAHQVGGGGVTADLLFVAAAFAAGIGGFVVGFVVGRLAG